LIRNGILVPLLFITLLTVQYSSAQTSIPISKNLEVPDLDIDESADTEDSGPEVEVEPGAEVEGEPTVKGEDDSEAEVEPEVQGGEPAAQDANQTDSEEPKGPSPKKEVGGSLDIANETQQLLPPAYQIKITFDAIQVARKLPSQAICGKWDLGVYVQGKLVRLDNMGQPLKVCKSQLYPLKDAEATVDIPAESVESPKDYQPLSIFTAGSQLDNCDPKPLPGELPEVRKILADKGSTRPYYANADENIKKIQFQISNGCIPKTNAVWCDTCYNVPVYYDYNASLTDISLLEASPGYGKVVSKDTIGNPESVQIDTCTYGYVDILGWFCLYYTIDCPLCAAIRVH
jgi:hypothetical protein